MNARPTSSLNSRLRLLSGAAVLAVIGTAAAVYCVDRWQKLRRLQDVTDRLRADTRQSTVMPTIQATATVTHASVTDADVVMTPKQIDDSNEQHQIDELETMTVDQLYQLARRHNIEGRSRMRKAQLVAALQRCTETQTPHERHI